MIKDVLRSMDLGFWAAAAMILFMLVFSTATYLMSQMTNKHLDKMCSMPLDDNTINKEEN